MTGRIVCHLVKSSKVHEVGLSLAKASPKNSCGVYASMIRPGDDVVKELKSRHINIENWFVVDASGNAKHDRVISIPSPEAVTELSIVIGQSLQSFDHQKSVLILEGLNTLATSNGLSVVQRFVQFLIGKLRSWGVDAHIIASTDLDPSLITLLKQLCDAVKRN
jgi:hypothetical protein